MLSFFSPVVIALWVWVPASASAQVPPDPAIVVAPLLDAAETDLAEGRASLARGRVDAVLRLAPEDSLIATRARALRARADADVAATVDDAATVTADDVYEPLVVQAEADGAEGRTALGRARLEVVLEALPPGSTLATRARNLGALLEQASHNDPRREPVPPPPGSGVPDPPPPGATQYAAPPIPPPPPSQNQPTADGDDPSDDDVREVPELIEGYVAAFGVGALAGISVLALADVDEAFWYASIPMLSGTAMIVPLLLLDTIGGGMPSGVASAISTGSLIGLGNGLLAWGAIPESLSAKGVLGLLTATTVGGALLGGLWGYGLRLSPAENRLVGAMAGWAAWTGLFSGWSFRDASDEAPFTVALAAGNTAAALALLLGAVTDISEKNVALAAGAPVMGMLVGLMVAGIIHLEADRDGRRLGSETTSAGIAIGTGSGLVLGVILAATDDGDDDEREEDLDASGEVGGPGEVDLDADSEPTASFDLYPVAIRGGGLITATGSF